MSYVIKTLIVPTALIAQVRQLTLVVGDPQGTWDQSFSPTGQLPATHWVRFGAVLDQIALMLTDPEALATATGMAPEEAKGLLDKCVVDDRPWEVVVEEMGLKLCEIPA